MLSSQKVANCPGVRKVHHPREGRQLISADLLKAGFQSVQTFHKLLEEIEAVPFHKVKIPSISFPESMRLAED